MQLQPPSSNGTHAAPHIERGAVVVPGPTPVQSQPQRPPTRFPEPLPGGGGDDFLYTLARGAFFGFPLKRVVPIVVVFIAVAWLLRPLPGGIGVAGVLLAALALLTLVRALAARRHYVRFAEGPLAHAGAAITPASLHPNDKVPIYLWGELEVQGRVRSFAALPGFYRTFATREHALIGLVVSVQRLGLARLPDMDAGLWYAFCTPEQIVSLRTGTVLWGKGRYPAIALARHTAPPQSKGRTQQRVEMLYIGTREAATLQRIWADLVVEQDGALAAVQAATHGSV